MTLPPRPRPWKPMAVTTILLRLSFRLCLAWHAPPSASSTVARTCFCPAVSGVPSRHSGFSVPYINRCFHVTQQRRTRVPAGLAVMREDSKGHRAFVDEVLALTGDPLEKEGGRIVVFRGSPQARLMLIGEAPGAEEDKLGLPFVGRSGKLLDDILRAVGLDPAVDVYVSNIVRRRPIENRTPTPDEMEFYLPILLEEIRLVTPDIIVTLGASSTKALLPFETRGITKARGQWADHEAVAQVHGGVLKEKLIMPWFHPSYLLRNAGERSRQKGGVRWHTRNDLHHVKQALDACRTRRRSSSDL